MQNIVLIGFMGTGKTSVAKAVANKTAKRYVSTDALIETKERMAIRDIFSEKGEPYFRDVEASVVREVSTMNGCVIDAGGGVIIRDENVSSLKKSSVLVCLEAGIDAILERTSGRGHRPLLNVPDPRSKIEELLAARAPLYKKSDVHVDTTDLSIDQAADEVIRAASRFGERRGPSESLSDKQ